MRRILDWIGKGAAETAAAAPAPVPGIAVERVGDFLRHFPIGTRVLYHPEFQRNIKLDSIILGYQVNGAWIYSDHAIRLRPDPPDLVVHTAGGARRVDRVEQFRFLVPFRSRSELDYGSAVVGPGESLTEKMVNDFKRGNAITLFNKGSNGKVPYLDTHVARVVDLQEGFYANRRVVLLEPEPDSFQFLDQRQYHRVYTRIPATLSHELESPGLPCVVQDFSERFLRIAWSSNPETPVPLRSGARLYLSIPVLERTEPFLLIGSVHRLGEAYAVVSVSRIFKHKRFQNLDLIDELDLKTTLLHQPETQKKLAAEDASG